MRYTYQIISLLLINLTLADANNLKFGDECQVNKTGKAGICKFLTECTEVHNDLRFNGTLPTLCGYKGFRQIICCPHKEVVAALNEEASNLSITVRKCKDYSRYVFTNISIILFDLNSAVITKTTDRCGHVVRPLIVDGSPATAREFPHSALLGYKMQNGGISWDCGGSLVSTRYVLTAGHCLSSPKYSVNASVVRLGELVLDSETDETEVIDVQVEQIIAHPNYSTSSKYNDIALLKLDRKVQLSPFVRPICLPTDTIEPLKAIATGWGLTEYAGDSSKGLLKVVLESYSNEECYELYNDTVDRKLLEGIIDTQLCFGSRKDLKDTCNGDSGGPVQIYNPDPNIYCMYTQVGITSFGRGCGIQIDFPAVYTRVYKYVQWIVDTIWAPGEDD